MPKDPLAPSARASLRLENTCAESHAPVTGIALFLRVLIQKATSFEPILENFLANSYNWYIFGLTTARTVKHEMSKLGAADIAAMLRRDIQKGERRQHERLPAERNLAEEYGVARNTVREALNRLEDELYVETRPGSGTYVIFQPQETSTKEIDQANPLELIDARFALEPHICRLSVLHGRRADFDRLEILCARMEAVHNDPAAFGEADTEFHSLLAETTGNRLLVWVIAQINSVRSQDEWTRMRQLTLDDNIISQYNAQHRQILNAIRTREPERAANMMKDHLETARLSLTRAAAT